MANRFITLVIQLPQSEEAAKSVTEGLSIGGNFRGGQITAMSLEDEITVNELLEQAIEENEADVDVDDVRANAAQMGDRVAVIA